jgi:hypothetical protein
MLVVRLLWVVAALIAFAAGIFYVVEGSTTAWHVGVVGALPVLILIVLRAFAIQRTRGEPTRVTPGWFNGSGPLGPP